MRRPVNPQQPATSPPGRRPVISMIPSAPVCEPTPSVVQLYQKLLKRLAALRSRWGINNGILKQKPRQKVLPLLQPEACLTSSTQQQLESCVQSVLDGLPEGLLNSKATAAVKGKADKITQVYVVPGSVGVLRLHDPEENIDVIGKFSATDRPCSAQMTQSELEALKLPYGT